MAKKQMNYYSKSAEAKPDTSKRQEQSGISMQSGKSVAVAEKPSAKQEKKTVNPTFDQIAERAKIIWQERGCPIGQDDKNWYDAEQQLKQELGVS